MQMRSLRFSQCAAMTAAAFGMVASSGQQWMDTAWGSKREARFEGVAGGDLRDETLLTAACQELRAAPSKIGSSLPDEYSVAGIVLPTVNFMILAGQYPEEVPLAGVFG